ncbi:hypothetical protein SteCoe_25838 [Stentor coeruleus]|uniref:Uncharacterized protein n=1 Tax=Stentor coeruleus TaxID=5963 RepID=A0A1R2BEB2_9CILI|nr:hypothetical protein SteCoe_25838 [Stentor coeruleus]
MSHLSELPKQYNEAQENFLTLQTKLDLYKAQEEYLESSLACQEKKINLICSELSLLKKQIQELIYEQISLYKEKINYYTKLNEKIKKIDSYAEDIQNIKHQINVLKGFNEEEHKKLHMEVCRRCGNKIVECIFC